MTLKEILGVKGSAVYTIRAHETIRRALELLVQHRIGALVVVGQDGRPEGMLSERDLIRAFHQHGQETGAAGEIPVSLFMTKRVITASLNDDIQQIMNVMTHSRIRHVPVIEQGKMVGLVSIGDIVKSLLQDSQQQIQTLKEFIYGPGL